MKDQIIEMNDYWVLVNKQANTLSVPSRFSGTGKDERPVLGSLLQDYLGKKVYPIHRLDFEVSGLIIYGLNSKFHKVANRWFEKHLIQKTYEAFSIDTDEKEKSGVWKSKILRGKKRAYEAAHGQTSITEYDFRGTKEINNIKVSEWLLKPITGKSHQLRYEMSKHGYPIIGDSLYGSEIKYWEEGIALKAISLDLSNISQDELDEFKLPRNFKL